ncbi:hypothetical protein BJ912DRAFT_920915 [Pholiota molesta]|nr:hypothetical protein BJ912DRAFT_920915 [Pholiota molesta]
MACIQALLMLRVYALYTQDRRIAIAMATLLVAELGSMPATIHLTLPDAVGNMCMKPITIRDIACLAILPQIIVLGLTVVKFLSGLRAGWGKIPIVSRLVRDDLILVTVIASSMNCLGTMYSGLGHNNLVPNDYEQRLWLWRI